MALNNELIKLLAILGVAAVVLIGGFLIQRKRLAKKKQEEEFYNQQGDLSPKHATEVISPEERSAKDYIEQYKGKYSRESIKQGLVSAGNSPENAQKYVDKYMAVSTEDTE